MKLESYTWGSRAFYGKEAQAAVDAAHTLADTKLREERAAAEVDGKRPHGGFLGFKFRAKRRV